MFFITPSKNKLTTYKSQIFCISQKYGHNNLKLTSTRDIEQQIIQFIINMKKQGKNYYAISNYVNVIISYIFMVKLAKSKTSLGICRSFTFISITTIKITLPNSKRKTFR